MTPRRAIEAQIRRGGAGLVGPVVLYTPPGTDPRCPTCTDPEVALAQRGAPETGHWWQCPRCRKPRVVVFGPPPDPTLLSEN